MTEGARAFVPGHVTGLFSIHRDDDPARAGSRGAGLTLTDGVTVSVRPADDSVVFLNGERADVAAVAGVLDALGVTARVEAETPLPVGAGFGVSGAMALGAAYAANAVFECGHAENALVRLAHEAEVEAGTGLGDVVAQARGGAPIREEPGAPPHGRLDGVPETARVEYASFGGLSTAEVLSGDTETLSAAGERALDRLLDAPTLDRFVAESRTFASEAGLLTDDIDEVVGDVLDAGGRASMAMLGRTVFALDHGLTDAGYDAEACRIHPAGATLR
ncbi:pantoate kinase [Salarchaeum japonicum]|uniref:Pantoate kinase n=1 Tax=Salarchaeum japonicum TaxID=555573 RepID=A0AAV3T1J1_9EURY|nr:pantoate kinase [Salarchaeum japonicum]